MGLFSAIGSIAGALIGRSSAKSQNKAASQEAEQSRLFTKEQLQNRHQWEVEDLRKAGLNPILSAGGTPSIGGSAQAPVVSEADQMSTGVSSAIQALMAQKTIENLQADTDKKKAETATSDNLGALYRKDYDLKSQQVRRNEYLSDLGDLLSESSEKLKRVSHSAASAARTFSKNPGFHTKRAFGLK